MASLTESPWKKTSRSWPERLLKPAGRSLPVPSTTFSGRIESVTRAPTAGAAFWSATLMSAAPQLTRAVPSATLATTPPTMLEVPRKFAT